MADTATGVAEGKVLTITAPAGGTTKGTPFVWADRVVIPRLTVSAAADVVVDLTGVHEVTAETGTAWSEGDFIYWDASAGEATATMLGNTFMGVADRAKLSATAFGHVALTTHEPPATLTMTAAAGGANVCEVTYQVADAEGNALAGVFQFDLWLSDAATGVGHTATTASGTVTAKSASGLVVATHVSKKALRVQTLATGVFILEITDSAKTGFYPAGAAPGTGRAVVADQLVTGDYGS